jgi:OPA family glycerol-3-phosphate transporter-like MFS transporter
MLLAHLRQLFAPAPHRPRLSPTEVARRYPRMRWAILESTFLGYATFYLVRNNLSTVSKELESATGYDHSMVGTILAVTAITYGLGKFLMGALSDGSNSRTFMAAGLGLTAVCNFAFGSVSSFGLHLGLWALNGFVQGMGWPPCGRSMGHWYSVRERGTVFAFWNIAHNVGGGIAGVIAASAAGHWGWRYAFYVPGVLALVGAVYVLGRRAARPSSAGASCSCSTSCATSSSGCSRWRTSSSTSCATACSIGDRCTCARSRERRCRAAASACSRWSSAGSRPPCSSGGYPIGWAAGAVW